jgi:uncharacterized protein (TIGR00255 family)
MISMTGFGQAEIKVSEGSVRVELKSINHKFLEISTRLPGHLADREELLRRQVSQKVRRGKIFLFVASPDPALVSSKLILNTQKVKEVFRMAEEVKKILKLKAVSQDTLLREVLHHPEIFTKDTSTKNCGYFSKQIVRAVDLALSDFNKSRAREGQALLNDFKGRVREIHNSLKIIEQCLPIFAKEYKRSLEVRMKDFLKSGEVDKERLTTEVAQYLKNSDISEEVTRLHSHLKGMEQALVEKGEVGRKIDFVAQEMMRETNTIGAKSSDPAIANCVIQIKSSIEKIREQSQNVE